MTVCQYYLLSITKDLFSLSSILSKKQYFLIFIQQALFIINHLLEILPPYLQAFGCKRWGPSYSLFFSQQLLSIINYLLEKLPPYGPLAANCKGPTGPTVQEFFRFFSGKIFFWKTFFWDVFF